MSIEEKEYKVGQTSGGDCDTVVAAKVNSQVPVPKRNLWHRLLAVALIAALVLGGLAIARYLLNSSPKARKRHHKKSQLLVQTTKLHKINTRVVVSGLGSVVPAREIEIKPEVSGRITALHPNFHPGGLIKKGEAIAEIDRRDFEIIVAEKEAAFKMAEADWQLEEGRQVVARRDWQLMREQNAALQNQDSTLALRQPQLARAQAIVAQAGAALKRARLDLRRTKVLAPFTGVVRNKYIDLGAQVSPQTAIITLTGVKTYWVTALIPVAELHWLGLDETNSFTYNRGRSAQDGVEVVAEAGKGTRYKGRIVNLLVDLDKGGLMGRILIAVAYDSGRAAQPDLGRGIPLLIGSFVRVEITGRSLTGVFKIPRSAVWKSEYVLLADQDNRLQIRQPIIVWKDTDWIYVKDGLRDGERLVLSQISAPVAGMILRYNDGSAVKTSRQGKGGQDTGQPQ